MSSDIENSMLFTIQSVVLIVPKNTGHILRDLSPEEPASMSRSMPVRVVKYWMS